MISFPGDPAVVHEYRTYVMEPKGMAAYLDLVDSNLLRLRQNICGRLLGFWFSEFGTLCQVHHIWEHESLDCRQKQRLQLAECGPWREEFLKKAWPEILSQEIRFLQPAIAISPPAEPSVFYEMRRYQAVVGKAGQLLQNVQQRPRASSSTLVGVWSCESPDPNEVLELVAHSDFVSRLTQNCRDQNQQSWLIEVASQVRGAVATMLLPAGVSPLK